MQHVSSDPLISGTGKQNYFSGCQCKLQLKYFNVVKAAIFISASQNIRYSRQISNKTITNTNIDKQIDR